MGCKLSKMSRTHGGRITLGENSLKNQLGSKIMTKNERKKNENGGYFSEFFFEISEFLLWKFREKIPKFRKK